jgi:hypothetical protein
MPTEDRCQDQSPESEKRSARTPAARTPRDQPPAEALRLRAPGLPAAKAAARAAGITPVVITGDHPTTVGVLARRLGILSGDEPVVTGRDLAAGGTRQAPSTRGSRPSRSSTWSGPGSGPQPSSR